MMGWLLLLGRNAPPASTVDFWWAVGNLDLPNPLFEDEICIIGWQGRLAHVIILLLVA